jgi:hypothetical protein
VVAFVLCHPVTVGSLADDDPPPAEVARVSMDRLDASVRHLTSFPTRHTLSPENDTAAQWLRAQFEASGYADVSFHDFAIDDRTRHNVVCIKPGADTARGILVVCAHYDSRAKDLSDIGTRAPGGDDNASGVAALLEMARVLRPSKTRDTIHFVAFSGEEQGLVGSRAYARTIHAAGTKVRVVINLDMVGHPLDRARPAIIVERDLHNRRPENDAASASFAGQVERSARYTRIRVKRGPIYASDYMPFEQLGDACIGLFDGADDQPFYHTADDGPGVVDRPFVTEVTRLAVASILEIAGAP